MTQDRYPKLRTMIAPDYPEAYRAMLKIDPDWYEEMARRDLPRLLAIAKVTPEQIASHWAKWNESPGMHIVTETGEYLDMNRNPLPPEVERYYREFYAAADAYYESGDMHGFQELGIFPPAGDPAYEELEFSRLRVKRGIAEYGSG